MLGPARLAFVVLLALTAVFATWLHQLWGGPETVLWMENLALTFVPLAAAAACLWRSRRSEATQQRAWRWIAAGVASWGLASGIVTYIFSIAQADVPLEERTIAVPGIADVFFLAFFPLVILGILRLPRGRFLVTSKWRTALDAAAIVMALVFLAVAAGVTENLQDLGAGAVRPDLCAALPPALCAAVGVVLGVANPLGDLMLASVAVFAAGFAPRIDRRVVGWLAAGFVAVTIADVDFSTRWLRQDTSLGNLMDAGWVLGFGLVAIAALEPARTSAGPGVEQASLVSALVVYVPVVAALVTAIGFQVQQGTLAPSMTYLGFLLIAIVLGRQALTVLTDLTLRREAEAAYTKLQEAEQFRTRLLHNITHDLQNPLSPIQIQLRLLQDAGQDEATANRLAIIARNVEQMKRLIADLGDLAKLQDGKLQLVRQTLDVSQGARDVWASFQPIADERGIRFDWDATVAAAVQADDIRIRQILSNLVSNALKFTPRGGRVQLQVQHVHEGVQVCVIDSGRGLTDEEMKRLFRPFSQVHERGESPERGTGLGLFISRGLAESHGGSLTVTSPGPGQGSTFCLRLPT